MADRIAGRVRAVINSDRDTWFYVCSPESRHKLKELLDLDESRIPETMSPDELRDGLDGARIILSSWGAAPLTPEILDRCPDLELVIHAAGSIKGFFTDQLHARGVKVCSAVHLNARPTAEFTLGLILTACKQVFDFNTRLHRDGNTAWHHETSTFSGGYFRTRVGLLGYGRVAMHLLKLLQLFDFEVYLADPLVDAAVIRAQGAIPATLERIMGECHVVSLHHANTPRNHGLINKRNLALLKPGSHIINTARGELIVEQDLAARLERGDITAYLDVTHPEPPVAGHPFFCLPNCILTPHIAGSVGREVWRMGDYCVREVENWLGGLPLENMIDSASVHDRA